MEAQVKPAFGLPSRLHRSSLGAIARLGILFAVLLLEKTVLSGLVDSNRVHEAQGFGAFVRIAQHWGFRFIVATIAAIALFAYVRGGEKLELACGAIRASRLRIGWACWHAACFACLIPLSYFLYREEVAPAPFFVIVWLWIAIAGMGVASLLAFLAPRLIWQQSALSLGNLWGYGALAGVLSAAAIDWSQQLWEPTAAVTFNLVRQLLRPIIPALVADPATQTLSTPRFAVQISELCSGLEGIGLIIAFAAAWLIYFRREYFFPRALLLIPAAVAASFALNVVRIAVLVLIGDAGYPDVAIYGFHSQAGWIAFIAVACGLVLLSRRSSWLYREAALDDAGTHSGMLDDADNPTAAYLVPLLAIIAAGILSHAMSGSFEYFYPLRVIAGVSALIWFWRRLADVDWRFSWRGILIGAAVFVVWLVAAQLLLLPGTMPARLAAMSPLLRLGWVLSRILGSVCIVPIAEELAYRGYLMRRLCNADFESLPYPKVTYMALLGSSIVFGLAHGAMWLAGILAGAAYGLLAMRRGRLGEAVVAHATSNALIAVSALLFGQWQLW